MNNRPLLGLALAGASLLVSQPAFAHGFAGPHLFVSTLILDDPNVADEASVPTIVYQPQPNNGGPITNLYAAQFEFDKRFTENFGFAINSGYDWLTRPGAKTANGWENLSVTLKYKVYVDAQHEFMESVGVIRNFARTGANGENGATLGNDDSSSTAPTYYFGKGFGDLPIGWARAFAITGELSYQIADVKPKIIDAMSDLNNGTSNTWIGGLSLQYSMRYLASQVKDYGLPEFVNQLTPLVEFQFTAPTGRPSLGATQYLIAPGINYTATTYAWGIEALIPGNKATGSHVGVIAQFHLYFDDLFPNSLGKPIFDWRL
jgi:hypothetical protein